MKQSKQFETNWLENENILFDGCGLRLDGGAASRRGVLRIQECNAAIPPAVLRP